MTEARQTLPHQTQRIFLTDSGPETDIMFNRGFNPLAFNAFTLLNSPQGRRSLKTYFSAHMELAAEYGTGYILDTLTYRAQREYARRLCMSLGEVRDANLEAVDFAVALRDQYNSDMLPVLVNGVIGPCCEGLAPGEGVTANEAEAYHHEQIGWLAGAGVDFVTAANFTCASEAIGLVRATQRLGIESTISFILRPDGRLPSGQTLEHAIDEVDARTGAAPMHFLINCAHPTHVTQALSAGDWIDRLRGFRCNASSPGRNALRDCGDDCCDTPDAFAQQCDRLLDRLPRANVLGGCCGSGLLHMEALASRLVATARRHLTCSA